MTTAAKPAQMRHVSLEMMLETKSRIEALPKGKWVLISPDGKAWVEEDPAELLKVLLPHHPLLKPLY